MRRKNVEKLKLKSFFLYFYSIEKVYDHESMVEAAAFAQ